MIYTGLNLALVAATLLLLLAVVLFAVAVARTTEIRLPNGELAAELPPGSGWWFTAFAILLTKFITVDYEKSRTARLTCVLVEIIAATVAVPVVVAQKINRFADIKIAVAMALASPAERREMLAVEHRIKPIIDRLERLSGEDELAVMIADLATLDTERDGRKDLPELGTTRQRWFILAKTTAAQRRAGIATSGTVAQAIDRAVFASTFRAELGLAEAERISWVWNEAITKRDVAEEDFIGKLFRDARALSKANEQTVEAPSPGAASA